VRNTDWYRPSVQNPTPHPDIIDLLIPPPADSALHEVHGGYIMEARLLIYIFREVAPGILIQGSVFLGAVVLLY